MLARPVQAESVLLSKSSNEKKQDLMSSLSDFRSGLRRQINTTSNKPNPISSVNESSSYFSGNNKANASATASGLGNGPQSPSLSFSKLISTSSSRPSTSGKGGSSVLANASAASNSSGLSAGFLNSINLKKEELKPRAPENNISSKISPLLPSRPKTMMGFPETTDSSLLGFSFSKTPNLALNGSPKLDQRVLRSTSVSKQNSGLDLNLLESPSKARRSSNVSASSTTKAK